MLLKHLVDGKSGEFQFNCCLSDMRKSGVGEGQGSGPPPPPLKNHKEIGFLSNTGPDPLEKHKATKPAFVVGP